MKLPKQYLLILLVFMMFSSFTVEPTQKLDLPKVFLIGEHEDKYDGLSENFNASLIDVCSNDVNKAFKNWIVLVKEIEDYSKEIEFDIDGIKVWINVYWSLEGSIEHIAYYLKPDSRRIDNEEMNAFLTSFINNYSKTLKSNVNFTHSGSATFPTAVAMGNVEK